MPWAQEAYSAGLGAAEVLLLAGAAPTSFCHTGRRTGLGAIVVIALFLLLFAWRGFKIAINAPDNFGSLLAYRITVLITFQAAINIECAGIAGYRHYPAVYQQGSSLFTLIKWVCC